MGKRPKKESEKVVIYIVREELWFEKGDYSFVRKQFKDKHIKIQNIVKEIGISRTYIYDMFVGNRRISKALLDYFNKYDIVLPLRIK